VLFNSFVFLFVFLPLVVVAYFAVPLRRRARRPGGRRGVRSDDLRCCAPPRGAACADVYHAFTPKLLAPDHIHPNAAGHRLIARLLYTAS
jgi:hypothetical protein